MSDVTTPYDLYIDLMDSAVYPYVNGIPGTKFIELYQNEAKASIFNIHISKNYEFLDLKDKTVRIGFKKPDDEIVWQPCTIVDAAKGKVQVVLEEQTLAVAGKIRAQVQVSDAENRSAESAVFYLYVHESVITKKAIQSTSAAPLLEDAVKAGELFKDYKVSDLAAIKPTAEAAKQAADGALPKTGGTVNGDIKMANGKSIRLQNAEDKTIMTLGSNSGGGFYSWSDVAAKGVFKYDPVTHFMEIQAGTNVYKKTDIYGAFTQYDGRAFNITGQDLNTIVQAGQYSGQNLSNTPEGAAATTRYYYIEVVKHLSVNYAKQIATTLATTTPTSWIRTMNNGVWGNWIPLIDANGGTMTGDLVMNTDKNLSFTSDEYLLKIRGQKGNSKIVAQVFRPDGSSEFISEYRGDLNRFTLNCDTNLLKKAGDSFTGTTSVNNDVFFAFKDASGTGSRAFKLYPDGKFSLRDLQNGNDIFNVTGGKFNVNVDTNLVTKTKDGQAALTLTADATNANSGYMPLAERRGNTVSMRMEITRNAGSANPLVCTLPVDMRPPITMSFICLANDGTPVSVNISWNGNVEVYTTGKQVKIAATYVVN